MNGKARLLDLCAELPIRTFAPGEIVLREGERSGLLLVLAEGRVELLKNEIRIATLSHPGAVFGDMSILLNQAHSVTVRCLSPSRFFVVENPEAFLLAQPGASLAVARGLAERLDSLTRYLVDLKAQYEDRKDHLGMIDEVLESLLHHQRKPPVA